MLLAAWDLGAGSARKKIPRLQAVCAFSSIEVSAITAVKHFGNEKAGRGWLRQRGVQMIGHDWRSHQRHKHEK